MSSYACPTTLDEALIRLEATPCRIVAGATDVYPLEANRFAWGAPAVEYADSGGAPPMLDISGIEALARLERTGAGLLIGAGVTWSDLAEADLPRGCAGLRAAGAEIGARQVQNRATVAGNLCNASPAADGAVALLALGARVRLASRQRVRELALEQFLLGARRTALASDELLTHVIVPPPMLESQSRFEKLGARRYLVISIVMVAVNVRLDAVGEIVDEARIAVGACAPTAVRLQGLEDRLQSMPPGALPGLVRARDFDVLSPIDDMRADAGYRLHAARVLTERALRGVTDDAQVAGAAG